MIPTLADNTASVEVAGERLIINGNTKRIFVLNTTGNRLFEHIDGTRDITEIVELIPSPKPFHVRMQEASEFMRVLEERGIVELKTK